MGPDARFWSPAGVLGFATLFVAVAGCLDGPITTEPTGFRPTIPRGAPDFVGDWATVGGAFTPLVVAVEIRATDATTGTSVEPQCGAPGLWTHTLDRENETLTVTRHLALHPLDPGPLRVVLLVDAVSSNGCRTTGVHGVNENATSTRECLGDAGVPQGADWVCRLPLEPLNQRPSHVWLNASVTLHGDSAGGFAATVNGHAVGDSAGVNFTQEALDEARGVIYEAAYAAEPLGSWPYASVRRA